MFDIQGKVALGVSGGGTVVAWLSYAQPILTAIATIVSIVAGIYAIRHYRKEK